MTNKKKYWWARSVSGRTLLFHISVIVAIDVDCAV